MTQCSQRVDTETLRLSRKYEGWVEAQGLRLPLTVRRRQALKWRRVRTFGNINSQAKQHAGMQATLAGNPGTLSRPLHTHSATDNCECIHCIRRLSTKRCTTLPAECGTSVAATAPALA